MSENDGEGALPPEHWEPPADAPFGGRPRGVLMLLPAVVFAFLYPLLMIPFLLLVPRWFEQHHGPVIRGWGTVLLAMFGVRVEEHGRAAHRLGEGPRIVLFNHVSLLDLMVLSRTWDPKSTVVYKREFGRIPVIGLVMKRLNFIPIDRGDREAARSTIEATARRVREQSLNVLIAPEGTRSRRGGLQRFKMGAFVMAVDTGAPLVPMIMRGIERCNPMGSWIVRPGTVRVDYLEPISPAGWNRDRLRRHAEEVRQAFLRYLPPAPDSRTGE